MSDAPHHPGDAEPRPEQPQYGRMGDPSAGEDRVAPPARESRPAPRRRRPRMAMTWVLIGVNLAVYGLQWLLLLAGIHPLLALGMAPGFVREAPWTVVTSGFAHSMDNPAHLLLNMYTLWIFGQMLEPEIGRWRFLAVYGLSLLGGSTAVLLLSSIYTVTVGASGAIFGLFGAVLAFALWGPKHHRGNLAGILVLIGINTVFGLMYPGISWQGHLGGLVTGAAVMGVMLAAGLGRRTRTRR